MALNRRTAGRSLQWIVMGAAVASNASYSQPPAHPNVVQESRRQAGGEFVQMTNGLLRLIPCNSNIIHVSFAPGHDIPDLSNPAISDAACPPIPFRVEDSPTEVALVTPELRVAVNRNSGAVHFTESGNHTLLAEADWPFPRRVAATVTSGYAAHEAATWFALTPEEHLYGLGQHQTGVLDNRNLEFSLAEDNTNISIPFFLSSEGYGLLWNSASVTNWNNRFRQVLAIRSNNADAVDYYFIAGPSFDRIVAGYRHLTGAAPLFPKWAYGYWQSKLAYNSSEQLAAVADRYRATHIPLDSLVLDAGWETVFGSRVFTKEYPDPSAMVQHLHDNHVHLMVSIWPLFQPGSTNFTAMDAANGFVQPGPDPLPSYLPGARLYDAFRPAGRTLYWQQAKSSLYDIGVDAFWLDSTEPADLYGEDHGPMLAGTKTALGDGSKYANLFPLMTTTAIYQGQRSLPDSKRVFILTRSAFAGMQRNAAAAWSGDTLTTFDTFRRQIPAGLNYSMTGLPYWTTDIGGFLGGDTNDPAYRELFVRWFEYGAFCPIFRAHGARKDNQNELWSFGPQAQSILTLYDRLRYRLLPYIYAVAAMTTYNSYTPMRALAFDFREDPKALDTSDEFMFGPSLLVAPVTEAGAFSRTVYLPRDTDWYDFWTGERLRGGQSIARPTPLDVMPLYVRAGSILPLGPEQEYVDEHPGTPLELRIYPGSDGNTSLYADDGVTYAYERGQRSWIHMHWSDLSRTLTLSAPEGHFPGQQRTQEFHVTFVSRGHGTGEAITEGDRVIRYSGQRQRIHFEPSSDTH
jgi:alpha-D-xyloside xylohydrolase